MKIQLFNYQDLVVDTNVKSLTYECIASLKCLTNDMSYFDAASATKASTVSSLSRGQST
jgi:hypothetical protein